MNSRGIDEFSTDEGTEVSQWTQFGMKMAVSSALHPFEYAKVLIQVVNSFRLAYRFFLHK
jgi:hypothetical protein